MSERKTWQPDMEETIRNIIRGTVSASGGIRPDELPHIVRTRLEGRVSGDVDVDSCIRSVLADMKKKGEV